MPRLIFCLFLLLPSVTIFAADDPQPEKVMKPKGGVSLTLNPSVDGPNRAMGVAVRFIPGAGDELIAVHQRNQLVRWNWREKRIVWQVNLDGVKDLMQVEVSPDGSIAFMSSDNGKIYVISLVDGSTLAVEKVISGDRGSARLAIGGDTKSPTLVYSAGNRGERLEWRQYSVEPGFSFGDRYQIVPPNALFFHEPAISADASHIAAGSWGHPENEPVKAPIHFIDAETEEYESVPTPSGFRTLRFSNDGSLLAGWGDYNDLRLVIFDSKTHELKTEMKTYPRMLSTLRFSADDSLLFATGDLDQKSHWENAAYLKVFDVKTGRYLALICPRALPASPSLYLSVYDLDISADGKTFALALDDGQTDKDSANGSPDIFVFELGDLELPKE